MSLYSTVKVERLSLNAVVLVKGERMEVESVSVIPQLIMVRLKSLKDGRIVEHTHSRTGSPVFYYVKK